MPSLIYVVIKAARDPGGEIQMATAEQAFTDAAAAEQYVKEKGSIWEEVSPVASHGISINYQCYCQRVIHPVELT